ncbi:carboxylesterase family protein [Streptomyces sp. ASQP_92]|uniref:alpha/beta hydrolase n=1 Tax=Streptomyces sp. ASQP_92 TaxID=2979116 RepID=UPI0021C03520|nr:alpha/beta fold hydrolase [Streptomyces sp. ASQP_92]MCT9090040.1 carboxylesterase family protein [Streptomyces sp. ASQP_92]
MPISTTVQTVACTTGPAAPQLLDVYRPRSPRATTPAVLLWHGMGPDMRSEVGPLAEETASHGLTVFVPDWRSDSPDGGRAHLTASLRYVRENAAGFGADPERLVVAGWSAGAGAAIGTALRPDLLDGSLPKAVVGIAGLYWRPARSTGSVPLEDLARAAGRRVPVVLVHGTADTQVECRHSRDFLAALDEREWPAALHEPETDHAGVIMTAYDPDLGRCVPTADADALRAGRATARLIAEAALA